MTEKQKQTSRLNSQKSTGPRTGAGKARSSMNALKSGIDARTVVLPTESQEEYNQLVAVWHDEHKPVTAAARALVDRLVANEWLNRRYFTLATTILAKYIKNNQKYIDPEFPIA